MTKRIVTALLVVALLAAGYWSYLRYKAGNRFENGEVTFGDVRDSDGMPAQATPSRSDDPGTVNTEPTSPTPETKAVPAPATPKSGSEVSPTAPATTTAATTLPASASITPVSDSQSPNAPNGVGFAGTGRFQVYRQGNLTWRVNTETGSTCVLFATNEEWRKPIVFHHGCNA